MVAVSRLTTDKSLIKRNGKKMEAWFFPLSRNCGKC